MEFGLFMGGFVPKGLWGPIPTSAEHERLMSEVRLAEAADRTTGSTRGRPSTTSSTEYSHISANEVFLALRRRPAPSSIHIGSGIFNITPPVNHPARVAERVAMLDHLSTGASSSARAAARRPPSRRGFGITDPELTKDMFDEVIAEFTQDVARRRRTRFDGRFFSMPARNVLPKPYVEAAPADVGRGRQPGARSRRPARWASACCASRAAARRRWSR